MKQKLILFSLTDKHILEIIITKERKCLKFNILNQNLLNKDIKKFNQLKQI